MTVYILFEKDYHLLYEGVFTSEKEVVKYIFAHDLNDYELRAYDADTNERHEVSESIKSLLHWLEWDAPDEVEWTHELRRYEYEQKVYQAARKKFPELFD